MKFRNLAVLLSMALLIGLTACSTPGEAEADEQAEQAEQAQTQQQTDDHAAHHPGGPQAGAEQKAGMQQTDKQQMMMQMCPMQVQGTTRQAVKLDDAVAMDFTTTGDVEELRQRVQNMAQMHEQRHADGGMMQGGMHRQQGKMQQGKMHGQMTEEQRQMRQQMMQMMSDVTVDTEEIDGGMRMKFTPMDSAQADKLYHMMQKNAQMMADQGQQCPMMQMMGGWPAKEQNE